MKNIARNRGAGDQRRFGLMLSREEVRGRRKEAGATCC